MASNDKSGFFFYIIEHQRKKEMQKREKHFSEDKLL
jgi:hypothetical protein